jgi:hypothetical protein
LTLAGLLALPAVFAPSVASAATPTQTSQKASKVEVDLELRHGDAKAASSAVVEVGSQASFDFGDTRQMQLTIEPTEGDALSVTFSMKKGSKTIIKARTIEASAGQTQEIKLGKGRVLALKVQPKSHRIELPDSNEPLAGL